MSLSQVHAALVDGQRVEGPVTQVATAVYFRKVTSSSAAPIEPMSRDQNIVRLGQATASSPTLSTISRALDMRGLPARLLVVRPVRPLVCCRSRAREACTCGRKGRLTWRRLLWSSTHRPHEHELDLAMTRMRRADGRRCRPDAARILAAQTVIRRCRVPPSRRR